MPQTIINPLSDMSRIKHDLEILFLETPLIAQLVMPVMDDSRFTYTQNWYGGTYETGTVGNAESVTLPGHAFGFPYTEHTEASLTASGCALFTDTRLVAAPNSMVKVVAVEIFILCRKDSLSLSDTEAAPYRERNILGNRVDCLCQMIHSSILSSHRIGTAKKELSIGSIQFSKEDPIRPISGTDFHGKILCYTYQSSAMPKPISKS